MEATTQKERNEIARLRFGLIAPVIQGTYADVSAAAYCRRVAGLPLVLPCGRAVQYKPKTLERWINLYNSGGMDALTPKTRCDKGTARVIPDDAESEIVRLRREFPRLNATRIYERLVHDGILPATVSVSSVQRYIKKHGLHAAAEGIAVKDRKAFEAAYFGGMWQADTCYLPYIREEGKSRRTYLIMVIDDHSRMIVAARLFYQENAQNFQRVLKDAVATYGIPHKLYADNGAPYSNGQLSFICGQIGTVLIHTPVRDGASKGKIERSFRTLKDRWLSGIDVAQVHSLAEFNRMLFDYVRKHNTAVNSTTGQAPLSRYLLTNDRIMKPRSREWLEECFHNRITRRINRDATLRVDNICYDAPMHLIGQKVEVRYIPGDAENVYVLHGGARHCLRPTDRVANANTRRVRIDYGMGVNGDVH